MNKKKVKIYVFVYNFHRNRWWFACRVVGQSYALWGGMHCWVKSSSATFVRVEWYWITLPVAVWGIGIVVWLGVVVQSRRLRIPVWRENVLPLLFLYRDGNDRLGMEAGEGGVVGGKDSNANWVYREAAGRVNVRLRGDGDRVLRLVRE